MPAHSFCLTGRGVASLRPRRGGCRPMDGFTPYIHRPAGPHPFVRLALAVQTNRSPSAITRGLEVLARGDQGGTGIVIRFFHDATLAWPPCGDMWRAHGDLPC